MESSQGAAEYVTDTEWFQQVQEAQSVELESQRRQRRMWEQTLPQLSPKFSSDALLYAVTVRRGRVLLLSDRHVIYCKARYYSPETFRLRWYLDVENINNVLGTSTSICMTCATFADVCASHLLHKHGQSCL